MPFVLPADPADGDVAPASWGDDVRNSLNFLANKPACRVYHSVAQSIPNNAETALAFDSERYDTDTMHSTVTTNSRITIVTAGLYLVTGGASWAANATGVRQIGVRDQATAYWAVELEPSAGASLVHQLTISTVLKLTAGQYIELVAYQNSGGALNINASLNYSPEFTATWLALG